jgi:hypothetical protein
VNILFEVYRLETGRRHNWKRIENREREKMCAEFIVTLK